MSSEFLTKVKELTSQRQATKSKIFAKTKLQGCAKLPVNRQSETSLGKGKKGGKILTLHVEGFQNSPKHVEGFRNLLKKQLELINK
jgi:hypothetical protein